jgi:hypothetical protein
MLTSSVLFCAVTSCDVVVVTIVLEERHYKTRRLQFMYTDPLQINIHNLIKIQLLFKLASRICLFILKLD